MHNREKNNEKKQKHFACASSRNDANATAWEGVKAVLLNSDAADHSL